MMPFRLSIISVLVLSSTIALATGNTVSEPYKTICKIDGDSGDGANQNEQQNADQLAYLIKRNSDEGYPELVSTASYSEQSTSKDLKEIVHYCVTSRRAR